MVKRGYIFFFNSIYILNSWNIKYKINYFYLIFFLKGLYCIYNVEMIFINEIVYLLLMFFDLNVFRKMLMIIMIKL